jgi:hypothetical protein
MMQEKTKGQEEKGEEIQVNEVLTVMMLMQQIVAGLGSGKSVEDQIQKLEVLWPGVTQVSTKLMQDIIGIHLHVAYLDTLHSEVIKNVKVRNKHQE